MHDIQSSKRLKKAGHGLIVVSDSGEAHENIHGIPAAQHIPETSYDQLVRILPPLIKRRTGQAYDRYQNDPVAGVQELGVIAEALIRSAYRQAIKANRLTGSETDAARQLDALYNSNSFQNTRSAVGGMRSFYSTGRNNSSHEPKTKRQAYEKFRSCHDAFREGLRDIVEFNRAMKGTHIILKA
jgi:hypothetical protein